MKITNWTIGFLLLAMLLIPAGILRAGDPPPLPEHPLRNAALSYWQAFSMMPELSDDQEELIAQWDTVKLDGDVKTLISQHDSSLNLMHRGARIGPCYWGSALEEGPAALLPHASKARSLARIALLRARWRLENDQPAEAWQDIRASMIFGRHVGSEQLLISVLVQIAMERMAREAIAPHLPTLSKEVLRQIADDLEKLPRRSTAADGMRAEKAWMGGWLRRHFDVEADRRVAALKTLQMMVSLGDGNENAVMLATLMTNPDMIKAMLDDLDKKYDREIEIMELPPGKFEAASAEFEASIQKSGNILVKLMLPACLAANRADWADRVEHAELLAAVDVVLHGEAKLTDHPCPATGTPFTIKKLSGGFELTSEYQHRDEPVTLRVGRE